MAINKLFAGNVGNPLNSKGSDVAETVNALIDATAGTEPVEAITLKGLPQTTGAPAGYGDLARSLKFGLFRYLDQFSKSQAQNIFSNPEWMPAPNHIASTAYAAGKAVTSDGKTYLCLVGGTTGAASPPTATTNAPIIDGAVQWLYLGASPTAIAGAPTVTLEGSVPAPLTKNLATTEDQTWFRVRGGNYLFSANGIGWQTGEPKNTSGLCFEFMTDAIDLIVMFKFGAVGYRVAVDGRFASPDTLIGSGTSRLRIQMNGDRKARKVQIFWNGSNSLSNVYVSPQDTVWRTSYPTDLNLFVVGDSFVGGSSFHPVTAERALHCQLAYQIGATQYQSDGVGGSGYIASGSETPFGSPTRVARIPENVNMLVIAGGINDPVSGLETAVFSYLQAVRARCPNAVIFVLGAWAGATGPGANILNKEAQISAAVTALSDGRVIFVPVSTATPAVVYGTGRVSAPSGNGNSDIYTSGDGTHPIAQAISYLASRVASGIISGIDTI